MARLIEATECYCAEYVGNHLYVAAKREKDFVMYSYDTVNNAWDTLPTIPGFNFKTDCLCSMDDYIYAIHESKPPHRLSLNTNQWQRIKSFNPDRFSPGSFRGKASIIFKSRLYVLHGQLGGCRSYYEPVPAQVHFFNPRTNKWKLTEPTRNPHYRSSLLAVNEKLCVAGGSESATQRCGSPVGSGASVEVYDEENNSWSIIRQNHIPPNDLNALEIEGKVYFMINNFPIDSGIRFSPAEVYPLPLNVFHEWENLGKIDQKAVLCYLPLNVDSLKAE